MSRSRRFSWNSRKHKVSRLRSALKIARCFARDDSLVVAFEVFARPLCPLTLMALPNTVSAVEHPLET